MFKLKRKGTGDGESTETTTDKPPRRLRKKEKDPRPAPRGIIITRLNALVAVLFGALVFHGIPRYVSENAYELAPEIHLGVTVLLAVMAAVALYIGYRVDVRTGESMRGKGWYGTFLLCLVLMAANINSRLAFDEPALVTALVLTTLIAVIVVRLWPANEAIETAPEAQVQTERPVAVHSEQSPATVQHQFERPAAVHTEQSPAIDIPIRRRTGLFGSDDREETTIEGILQSA